MLNLRKCKTAMMLGAFLFTISPQVFADVCEKLPAVNLNAISAEEVNNDMVRLNWQIQVQGNSANEVMGIVNRALDESIGNLGKNREISKIRNNIQTYPQYGKDRSIQAWQAMGSLSFEMKVQALRDQGALKVAKGLALSNLEYFPSEGTVETGRAKLLQQAMKEFQDKAGLVASGFGKSGYTLGEITVNDENTGRPRPVFARAYSAMADMASKSAVEVGTAPGSSQLSVSVNGRVCLKP